VRPRLLDLFCGAGGAGAGYYAAGFDVVGVDIEPQPHYPFEFHRADALTYDLEGFDAVHASPPCQFRTQMNARSGARTGHVNLLTPTRLRLLTLSSHLPWVIENVPGAQCFMRTTVVLHGGMFGLGVHRPRHFESNVSLTADYAPRCQEPVGIYGKRLLTRPRYRTNGNWKGKSLMRVPRDLDHARQAMGIEWMDWRELCEAIPPAYTEHLGRQLIAQL
jgi:DNA (cytosine-5)-methyltransferase 1